MISDKIYLNKLMAIKYEQGKIYIKRSYGKRSLRYEPLDRFEIYLTLTFDSKIITVIVVI